MTTEIVLFLGGKSTASVVEVRPKSFTDIAKIAATTRRLTRLTRKTHRQKNANIVTTWRTTRGRCARVLRVLLAGMRAKKAQFSSFFAPASFDNYSLRMKLGAQVSIMFGCCRSNAFNTTTLSCVSTPSRPRCLSSPDSRIHVRLPHSSNPLYRMPPHVAQV